MEKLNRVESGNEGRFLFPLFREKWEKEPSLIPTFHPFKNSDALTPVTRRKTRQK